MNPFGGKNPNGLYVPISETEQDFLSRLVEADDLEVVIHGWGILNKPRITVGDKRIGVKFVLKFNAPAIPMAVSAFDLELRTRGGHCVYRENVPAMGWDGKPVSVHSGLELELAWDISLGHIDPHLIKALMPHQHGLTSRRLDKDTGEATQLGNMKLTPMQKKLLPLAEPKKI